MGTSISAPLSVTTSATGIAPTAPGAPAISNVTSVSATLTWLASLGSPQIVYMPQFRLGGTQTFTNALASPQVGLTANITGLSPGAQYDFQVVASSSFPPTASSPVVSQRLSALPPSVPTLILGALTSTTAAFTWTASVGSPPITYNILGRTPAGSGTFASLGSFSGTSGTVTGLTPSSSYDFAITATGPTATSPLSASVTGTTAASSTVPSAPTNLASALVTTSSVALTWSAPSSGVSTGVVTYTVQYHPVSAPTSVVIVSGISAISATVPNLLAATAYVFTVFAVNVTGPGAVSAPLTVTTAGAGAVRSPFLQPGGNAGVSPWNTGIGTGAILSGPTDPDTLSLIAIIGTVNASNFGKTVVTATAADPLTTFTSTSNGTAQRDANLTVTLHCPVGTTPTGPFPGDNDISVYDTTRSPASVYTFGPCTLVNGVDTTGGVTATFGETNLICGSCADALTGNFGIDSSLGTILPWELDPVQNPSGRIRHPLRFALAASQLLPPSAWNVPVNPAARTLPDGTVVPAGAVQIYWPQTHTDFNGPTAYTGKCPAGALVCVPFTTAEPAGLSAGGHMLFDALKFQGAMWRDQSTGFTLYADKTLENHPMIVGMRGDMTKIVPLLRVVRNVGPTSMGGGGTILDPAPAPPVDPGVCGGTTAPGAPQSLSTTTQTASSVTLTWLPGTGALPQTYTVQHSPAGAGAWVTDVTGLVSP